MEGKDLFKPFRFRMAGDQQPPARYHGFARRLMQRARQTAALIGGGVWAQKETLDDGTVLHATIVGGIDTVWVTPAARRGVAVEEDRIEIPSFEGSRFWASVRYNWALPVLFGPSATTLWPDSGPEAVEQYDLSSAPGANPSWSEEARVTSNFQVFDAVAPPVKFLGSSYWVERVETNDQTTISEISGLQTGYKYTTETTTLAGFTIRVSRQDADVITRVDLGGDQKITTINYVPDDSFSAYRDYWEDTSATGYGHNVANYGATAALTADLDNYLFLPEQAFTRNEYYRLQWLGDNTYDTLVTHTVSAQVSNVQFVLRKHGEVVQTHTMAEVGGTYSTTSVSYAGDQDEAWTQARTNAHALRVTAYYHAWFCTEFFPFTVPAEDGSAGYILAMRTTHTIETGLDANDWPNLGYLKSRNLSFFGYMAVCTEDGIFFIHDRQTYGPTRWVLDYGVYFFPAKNVVNGRIVLDWDDVCLLQPLPAGPTNRFEHATLSVLERDGRKFVALWFAYDYSIFDLSAYAKYLRNNPTGPQRARKWSLVAGNWWWWLPPGETEFEPPLYKKERLFVWHTNANITQYGYVPKKNYLPEWMHAFY